MEKYTCPMHPEIVSDKPGRCPKCGMKLVKKDEISKIERNTQKDSYKPLVIIVVLIIFTTLLLTFKNYQQGAVNLNKSMAYFMAGFFFVFSGFKLIDLKGFAQGYSTYDLLAQKIFSYGYVYPFIELGIGAAYVLAPQNIFVNLVAFIVMAFSGLGVAIKIAKKERFQCSCLGTFLKVPLTKVTLVEDFGMALMALVMLV